MKAYTNTKFIAEFTDTITGYDYKLEIIPADTTDFTTTKTVVLPEGIIKKLSFPVADDKYAIEMNLMQMNLNLNLNLYYNTGTDDDLLHCLFYPFSEIDIQLFYDALTGIGYENQITAGNIFKFYIKFNGADDSIPLEYRLMFIGLQKNGIESGYDYESGILELEIVNIGKVLLETAEISSLQYAYQDTTLTLNCKVESAYINEIHYGKAKTDKYLNAFIPAKDNYYFWFMSLADIDTVYSELLTVLYRKLIRNSAESSVTIEIPTMKTAYKQLYDASGDVASSINTATDKDKLFHIIYVSNKNNTRTIANINNIGGLFYSDLKQDYQTLADYYSGICKQYLKRVNYNALTKTYELYNVKDKNNEITLTLNDGAGFCIMTDKPELSVDVLQRVTASILKGNSDDLESIELINNSSRTDNNDDIPIIHNNTLSANETWNYETDLMLKGISDKLSININNSVYICHYSSVNVDMKQYYYYGIPLDAESNLMTSKPVMIKIHHHCITDLGYNYDTDDLKPYTVFISYDKNRVILNADIINEQLKSGLPNINANALLQVFSNKYQTKLKLKTAFTETVDYTGINPIGCIWFNPYDAVFKFDLNEIKPETSSAGFFNGYPVEYWLVQAELILIDDTLADAGTVNFTLLGY